MTLYQGENFYIDGIEAGGPFYQQNDRQLTAVARLRFFDIPTEFQNEIQ